MRGIGILEENDINHDTKINSMLQKICTMGLTLLRDRGDHSKH
jgi:hypothetical protein